MPTFGIAEIKKVILQCKTPECNHEHLCDPGKNILIPIQCAKCNAQWSLPAVSYQVTRNVEAYSTFLNLIPSIRAKEAMAEESATEKPATFRIRFEFADPPAA